MPPQLSNQQTSNTDVRTFSSSTTPVGPQPLAELIRQKEYDGCLPLGRGRLISLYACLKTYTDKPNETHWYHWDTDRLLPSGSQRIKQISSIQNTSSGKPTLYYENGLGSKQLNYPPFWMWKLKGKEVKTSPECGFVKGQGNKVTYTLTCQEHKIQENVQF